MSESRLTAGLIETYAIAPAVRTRIDDNPIGKGVRVAGRYWRDMILVPVDNGQNLQSRLLKHVPHRLADLGSLCQKHVRVTINVDRNICPSSAR